MIAVRTTAPKVTIVLPHHLTNLLVDALDDASDRLDNAGWCWCPDTGECGICAGCAERFDRAYRYRDYRAEITELLDADPRPVALAFDARSWQEIIGGVGAGADQAADCSCLNCRHNDPCDDCAEQRCMARTYRALQARLTLRLRKPRKPRGTRARSRRRR
ncbi:hypothetical protein ABT352_22790 [Streptosporangium sp. NPDC000563]|uniref:hypothetical protein n=1 Tax=Streptosporangium sp. NPDC000563 TaxID=3154366 RepID=UPI00331D782A